MFRNRELRHFAICFIIIALISTLVGFSILPAAGFLSLFSAIAFGTIFFLFTKARYKSIARVSDQIDLVLHNVDHLYMSESNEGELSILECEIKKMTLRMRKQNEALKQEKSHLADSLADIAHQLRTPLTSVNLILSLLEDNPDENERKALIRETKELFVQMDWLLTSLLKISRLDAGIVVFQSEQIDVNSLINTALHPFLISLDLHNITIQKDIPKDCTIKGDSGWLSEALQNIIKNCMESTGEDGTIAIGCIDTPLFSEITIHDSGSGFDSDDLPSLFERFYRGKKSSATGYGIGLALCKTIISRQGGWITAKNHPEGGAVFALHFPK